MTTSKRPYPRKFKILEFLPSAKIPGGWVDLLTDKNAAVLVLGDWSRKDSHCVSRWEREYSKAPSSAREFTFRVWGIFPDETPEFNEFGEVAP